MDLPDVQATKEGFPKIGIPRVGVSKVVMPVMVYYPRRGFIPTASSVEAFCSLTDEVKGINMSRLIEVLYDEFSKDRLLIQSVKAIQDKIKTRLGSPDSMVRVKFNYFVYKLSPVTKIEQLLPIKVELIGRSTKMLGDEVVLGVSVPYTSLCCCSKAISDRGAHNQRSEAFIYLSNPRVDILFEDVVSLVEKNASAEIREILKREDEKYVTEKAYDNPVFVEDVVRRLAEDLESYIKDGKVSGYLIKTEHQESIHAHNAIAYMCKNFKLWELLV